MINLSKKMMSLQGFHFTCSCHQEPCNRAGMKYGFGIPFHCCPRVEFLQAGIYVNLDLGNDNSKLTLLI